MFEVKGLAVLYSHGVLYKLLNILKNEYLMKLLNNEYSNYFNLSALCEFAKQNLFRILNLA